MIGRLLLALWLILVGATWLTWINVDTKFLGLLGFITGIVLLVETAWPVIEKRP